MNPNDTDDRTIDTAPDAPGDETLTAENDNDQASKDPQAALREAQAKIDENWNLYLGARAEIENIRKRLERDVANARKFALEKFVNELLPVKDSIELGISAASETDDVTKLKEGNELTLKLMESALGKFGVEALDPIGHKFNPEVHEAMAMQPSNDAEPNTVLQVVQKGYLLNERLVRPAMVIVSQATPNATK